MIGLKALETVGPEDRMPQEMRVTSTKPRNVVKDLEETYKNYRTDSLVTFKNGKPYKSGTLTGYRAEFHNDGIGPKGSEILMLLLRDATRIYIVRFEVDARDHKRMLPIWEKVITTFKSI